jgi:AcrR family transcriptional regulator
MTLPAKTLPVPTSFHERRLRLTAGKLRDALDRLVRGVPVRTSAPGGARRLTVAALAREAGVGRNAIYANHRDILEDLARARSQRIPPDRIGSMAEKLAEQRAVIDDMQRQIRQLATANAALLRRVLEAERLAERAERRCARLNQESDALRRPVPLRRAES